MLIPPQFIAWYESEKRADLKGSLALHGAQVVASKRAGGFWVNTNSRTLEMVADNAQAAVRWIQARRRTELNLTRMRTCGTCQCYAMRWALAVSPFWQVLQDVANQTPTAAPTLSKPSVGGASEGTAAPPAASAAPPARRSVQVMFAYEAQEEDEVRSVAYIGEPAVSPFALPHLARLLLTTPPPTTGPPTSNATVAPYPADAARRRHNRGDLDRGRLVARQTWRLRWHLPVQLCAADWVGV